MKAILTNYRQSPRKVALVAGLIRGKTAGAALIALQFATKRASNPIEKLLRSAIANAKNAGVDNPENLFVNEIRVDKGVVLKRFMLRATGTSAQILKRSSNVILSLGEKIEKGNKTKLSAKAIVANSAKTSIKSTKNADETISAKTEKDPKVKAITKKAKKAE